MLKFKDEINVDLSAEVRSNLNGLDVKVLGGMGANIYYKHNGKDTWVGEFLKVFKKYYNLKVDRKFVIPVSSVNDNLPQYGVDLMKRITVGDLSKEEVIEHLSEDSIETSLTFRRLVKHVECSMKSSITIATHNTRFHADEVVACALLGQIYGEIKIVRIPHMNSLEELKDVKGLNLKDLDFLLDTGRFLDGFQYFDHHQYKGGSSTAGLVYSYLKEVEEDIFNFKSLSEIIIKVDEVDTGVNTGSLGDLSNIISTMYIDEEDTDEMFMLAINFTGRYIQGLISKEASKKYMVDAINKAPYLPGTTVKYVDYDLTGWNRVVFADDLKGVVEAVVTKKNDETYIIKTVGKGMGSYEKAGRFMPPHKSIPFTHATGFISKATDYESMLEYVTNVFPDKGIGFYYLEVTDTTKDYLVDSTLTGKVNEITLNKEEAIEFAKEVYKDVLFPGVLYINSRDIDHMNKKYEVVFVNEEFHKWPYGKELSNNTYDVILTRKQVEKVTGIKLKDISNASLVLAGKKDTPLENFTATVPTKVPCTIHIEDNVSIHIEETGNVILNNDSDDAELAEGLNILRSFISDWVKRNENNIEGLIKEK